MLKVMLKEIETITINSYIIKKFIYNLCSSTYQNNVDKQYYI